MKKVIGVLFAVIMMFSFFAVTASAEETVDVYVNGEYLVTDQPAIIVEGRTLVPVRAICEAIGCTVEWDEEEQTAYIYNDLSELRITIGADYMVTSIRGDESGEWADGVELDVPAMLYNNRTLVPARAVAESLYAKVAWDDEYKRVDITMEYDALRLSYDSHLIALNDGKYGVINENREVVVPLIYDAVKPYSADYIQVELNGKKGLVDNSGNVVIPIVYDDFYWSQWSGLTRVQKDGKWGYVNAQGEEFISAIYDEVYAFNGDYAKVKKDGKCGYVDANGAEIIPCVYDDIKGPSAGYFSVKVQDKWGFINIKGEKIVPAKYDEVTSFSNGYAMVKNGVLWGVINEKGALVIPVAYSEMHRYDDVVTVKIGGKWGLVDYNNNVILPIEYDGIYSNYAGNMKIIQNGLEGLINNQCEIILPCEYDDIRWLGVEREEEYDPPYESDYYHIEKDGKYGRADKNGEIVVPVIHDEENPLDYNYIKVYTGAKADGTEPEFILVDGMRRYCNGYAVVYKDKKYGYMDEDSNLVVPLEYDDAEHCNDAGYAIVEKDGKYGMINMTGEVVVPVIYDSIFEELPDQYYVEQGEDYFWVDKKGERIE